MVYGDTNVFGEDVESGLTVQANAKDLTEYSYVIDMLAKGNVLHRVVIPAAKPTEIGDIVYNDSDPVGYDVTLGCTGDAQGNTHYEYWQKTEDTPTPTPTPTYEYVEVTPVGGEDPSALGWYELVEGEYILSEDTVVDDTKTYYERVEA